MIQSAGLPAVHLSQNSHGNGEKQCALGRISGAVGIPKIVCISATRSGHRGKKIADLGGDIFALEVGVPIDSVLASDVAGIDMNELHFLHGEV